MSATIITDPMAISGPAEAPPAAAATSSVVDLITNTEVESAKCDCCGLTEEYTVSYIQRVRERFKGAWICGLCSEAVKYEMARSQTSRLISTEEAMKLHMNFCNSFRSSCPPPNPTVHLITAMRHVLRRSLDSPRGGLRSLPSSPTRKEVPAAQTLARSGSCLPSISG